MSAKGRQEHETVFLPQPLIPLAQAALVTQDWFMFSDCLRSKLMRLLRHRTFAYPQMLIRYECQVHWIWGMQDLLSINRLSAPQKRGVLSLKIRCRQNSCLITLWIITIKEKAKEKEGLSWKQQRTHRACPHCGETWMWWSQSIKEVGCDALLGIWTLMMLVAGAADHDAVIPNAKLSIEGDLTSVNIIDWLPVQAGAGETFAKKMMLKPESQNQSCLCLWGVWVHVSTLGWSLLCASTLCISYWEKVRGALVVAWRLRPQSFKGQVSYSSYS